MSPNHPLVGPPAPSAPPTLLRGKDVYARVALSRTTVWRLVKEAKFPPPVRLGTKRVAWREADISAWIEAQLPASEQSALPRRRRVAAEVQP